MSDPLDTLSYYEHPAWWDHPTAFYGMMLRIGFIRHWREWHEDRFL